jgi:hypothetical protein
MIPVPPLPQWSSSRRAATTTAFVSLPAPQFFRNYYSTIPARIKEAFEARDPSVMFHVHIPSSYQEPGRAQRNTAGTTTEAPISRTSVPDGATILYIGGQTLALTNLLTIHGDKNVCVCVCVSLTQYLIVVQTQPMVRSTASIRKLAHANSNHGGRISY